MDINNALKSIGLSEREIKAYLSCLKLGSATVNQISKEAGTFRTYTYDILRSLMEDGLVGTVTKEKTQYFEAADPIKIIDILKEREEKIREVLPELNSMKRSIVKKPAVSFYEGMSGVRLIHELILKEKPKGVRVYGNPEQHFKIMEFYGPKFIKERVKLRIGFRVIIKDSKTARDMKKKDKKELRQTRFFPEQPAEFPAITYMWNNKIAYFTIEKKIIAVIIEDENIAKAQSIIFENLWKTMKQ